MINFSEVQSLSFNQNYMEQHGTPLFTWHAPEFKHHDKGLWWYILLIIIATLLASIQIWKQDLFGAVVTGILALLSALITRRKPNIVEHHLTTNGVKVADLHIPYKHLKNFWVVNDGNHKTLNFETNTYFHRYLIFELHNQDPEPIREFLLDVVPEHELNEPTFSQWISHKTKF